ncbi:RNA polymerase sigma-70 factor [Prolixibacter sp. SD074]|uniref:RNA polymerase sigma-70 factor n=1 Tax=Prolixibacter sp. SD074 TaxID=2652391 RepID=UPI0012749524|nr:RNA polymerase sigma-70 factor [Prolixibacter sp. SD074]GET28845.1 DNA-directed RNA polymerase sigma-70 factor [Prolixibacter sp. SD074]
MAGELKNISNEEFRSIFDQYYPMLFHLGREYLQDDDEAKEVAQNAFVKLWEIRGSLSNESNIRNFLYTIARNNCLNCLKRREVMAVHHDRLKYLEMHFNYEALNRMGPDYLEFSELKEKIETAVSSLPENCRRVFYLSRFEDKSNKEIADELDVTVKTVEAHMTKALKYLRKELQDYLPVLMVITNFLN